ncbi:MAG: hypothetical protein Q8W46_06415 [Candidatus Palauibacterales bacterium]|nr:hypothetical protein [Candidatus Palauibacterales bacterium]
MRILRAVLVVLACVLLAAHVGRTGHVLIAGMILAVPLLLLTGEEWAAWTVRVALWFGALEWLRTLLRLARERQLAGEPWTRLAVILGAVALVTVLAAIAVRIPVPGADEGPGSTEA